MYSKWINAPADSPVEYYSELDPGRWETRKVEIFHDGRMSYASATQSTYDTRLGIVPVPSLQEIAAQPEFQVKSISADEFEVMWKRATRR